MCTITNIRYVNENRRWIGYKITMSDNNKNIVCKIDNSQQCCEHFGVSTNQDFSNFIGAEFLSIFIGDVETDDDNNEMRTVSLNILTDRGLFTITFYNEHNGYYSHDVFISNEDNQGYYINI